MMSRRIANVEIIKSLFVNLSVAFQAEKALGHLSANKEIENFFRDFLNLLYGYRLENANFSLKKNQDAFDLEDSEAKIAVQVTTTQDVKKIKSDLTKFVHRYRDKYDRLIFIYPSMEKKTMRTDFQQISKGFPFDAKRDRINLSDLLQHIQNMQVEDQESVIKFLEKELPAVTKKDGLPTIQNKKKRVSQASFDSSQTLKLEFKNPSWPVIGIVGAGFSGTVTAIRLLELAESPINLLLIDSSQNSKYGGLAYGDSNCGWEHLLNIQAGRISIYRERPTDFLDWVTRTPDKSDWPQKWQNWKFTASSPVPRRIYGQYLRSRFGRAVNESSLIVEVKEIGGTVEKIDERWNSVEMLIHSEKEKSVIHCDRLVIATGHEQTLMPTVIKKFADDEKMFEGPYSGRFVDAAKLLNERNSVLVLGTGLSAYDAILTLKELNFGGKIIMMSRNGYIHKPYPDDHLHEILPLPLPKVPEEKLSADQMLDLLKSELEKGKEFINRTQPNTHESIIYERVLKALEPWISSWIARSDAGQVKLFLDGAKSFLTTNRTGIVHAVHSMIAELRRQQKGQKLEIVAGQIQAIESQSDVFYVTYSKVIKDNKEEFFEITPSMIVCCLGSDPDLSNSPKNVWKHLFQCGLVQVHSKTGRGISVDEFGALIRSDGSVSERIFAVGPMRQGDEIQRRGRIGAFVFSIGTIRNQALIGALRILWMVGNKQYSQMDPITREVVDEQCSLALNDRDNANSSKRLVDAILAVRMARITDYLNEGDRQAAQEIIRWLGMHLDEAQKRLPDQLDRREVFRHVLWFQAHLKAAMAATDIRRLSIDHHRIRNFGANSTSDFLGEKLACVTLLRMSVSVFGAVTASMMIYMPVDKKLVPFAMFRRAEAFTPTGMGQGVTGTLVRAFLSGEEPTDQEGIRFCYKEGHVIGCIVPNYNALQDLKKDSYAHKDRRYPSVLVALLVLDGELLGVIYVEAESGRDFKCQDVALLAKLMSSKLEIMKQAQVNWDQGSVESYRFGEFEGASLHGVNLAGKDLTQAIFRNANMTNAKLEAAVLTGAQFDRADIRSVEFRAAKLLGTRFVQANAEGADFAGAFLTYCDFTRCKLAGAKFAGAKLNNCSFVKADLSGVELRDLNVSGVNFSGALMRGCVLKRLTGTDKANWSGVDLRDSRVDRATWEELPLLLRRIYEDAIKIE